MSFCGKCGTKVEEGVKFCPSCGNPMDTQSQQQTTKTQGGFSAKVQGMNNTADNTASFDIADIEKNKGMAVLAYLSWLVLIPIFGAKDSKFARYHSNQGLVLAITEVIWWVAQTVLTAVFWSIFGYRLWRVYSLLTTVLGLVNIAFAILVIIGIINVVNGKAKDLPVIGKFKLLK